MCTTCGCSDAAGVLVRRAAAGRRAAAEQGERQFDYRRLAQHATHEEAGPEERPQPAAGGTVPVEQEILAKNSMLAERNRDGFGQRHILALNLVSSPGSGKTTLLERTIRDLGHELPIAVIGGDQATANDMQRIAATGCKAVQINTGTGCHLDADMVARGLRELAPSSGSIVMIENVGNLVCPALFDLGERAKVALLSVTEGEDKPLKYPHMFRAARLLLITKTDLLPYLDFDIDRCIACARQVNRDIEVIRLSAKQGDGLNLWYDWLRTENVRAGAGAAA